MARIAGTRGRSLGITSYVLRVYTTTDFDVSYRWLDQHFNVNFSITGDNSGKIMARVL